jgi:serine protease Do
MRRFLLFVIIVVLFIFGLERWNAQRNGSIGGQRQPEKFTLAENAKLNLDDVKVLSAMEQEYTKLVEAVVPSVVSITASKRIQGPMMIDPYELWFRGRLRGVPQEREARSLGSGVIVSKEGHIITNHHVVADVDQVQVQLSNGKEAPARVIGTDEENDIAVLKVDGMDVTPLPFGDSDQVKVGSRVIAVGNPFGLEETVTQGIISAKGRRAMQDSTNEFFQTDAAINPGNSGGPLVNLRGEIIGINSSIYSGSGGWQGVGFAIPSNVARRTMESILKKGRVVRGYLGIVMQPLTQDLAQQFGMKDTRGVVVAEVTPDSPAQKAGVQSGDVIVKFDGNEIADLQELRNRVAAVDVGSKVEIVVRRGKQDTTLTAKIAERPADFVALRQQQPAPQMQPNIPAPPQPMRPPSSSQRQNPGDGGAVPAPKNGGNAAAGNVLSGVQIGEIPPDHQDDLPPNVHGVMVMDIDENSPAAESLQQGDVIEEINREPVNSVADYNRIVQKLAPNEKQMLFIARGKTRSFVVLTPR